MQANFPGNVEVESVVVGGGGVVVDGVVVDGGVVDGGVVDGVVVDGLEAALAGAVEAPLDDGVIDAGDGAVVEGDGAVAGEGAV